MKHRGAFTVFAAAFAVVLIGGLALAQVGVLTPTSNSPEPATPVAAEITASNDDAEQPPVEEPTEGPGDEEPTEGPTEGPGDSEEPGDGEPTDDPKVVDPKDDGDDEPKDPEDTTPPHIEILHPEDGQVFHEKTIAFEGTTEAGAKVTAGRWQADVDREGNWRIRLVLAEGRNLARFTATDQAGNTAEATVTVVYEPKREDPPRVEFTAHQKYGSSTATPPFDVFHGTAQPGATIWIESEYGGKQTTANSKGNWEAKVVFAEAPVNKGIRVVVESSDGGRKVFEFVNKGSDDGEHEFSAHQRYGSCGEEVPYDEFWGTAFPGERIWVESPYGGGVTEANSHGNWEIRVEFPEAPFGKVFEVVVESEEGGRKVFTFVRTGDSEH